MSDVANAIRLKVDRANLHFSYLKTALGVEGGSPIPSDASDSVHIDNNRRLVIATDVVTPGLEHGVMMGDVVHQLRTCLDHIAYAMVKPRTKDPDILRKVQFPIFDNSSKLENNHRFIVLKRLFGDPSPEITEFRESQPYKRNPAFPDADHLWIVSELDNIDKHRTILVISPTVTVMGELAGANWNRAFRARKQPVKPGTTTLDIGWPIPDEPVEVDVHRVIPHIVFAETDGLCDTLSIFPLVREMAKAVSGVIDTFESKSLI